jgi:hypothetical protein
MFHIEQLMAAGESANSCRATSFRNNNADANGYRGDQLVRLLHTFNVFVDSVDHMLAQDVVRLISVRLIAQ